MASLRRFAPEVTFLDTGVRRYDEAICDLRAGAGMTRRFTAFGLVPV
jgi:hypothetical protein